MVAARGEMPRGGMESLAATDREWKVFYYKMKGDYYRDLAEFSTSDAKNEAAEDARVAYAEAADITEKDLVMTHSTRMGAVMPVSVYQSEVSQNPDEVRKVARVAFDTTKVILQERISERIVEQSAAKL